MCTDELKIGLGMIEYRRTPTVDGVTGKTFMRDESDQVIGGHRFAEILFMTGEAVGRSTGEPFCCMALDALRIRVCPLQDESCHRMIELHGNGKVLPRRGGVTVGARLFERTVRRTLSEKELHGTCNQYDECPDIHY